MALSKVLSETISVVGCGRTDAGVHATDFCLHFDTDKVPNDQFVFRLNQLLPHDIAVKSFRIEKDDFHARFDAVSRSYEYHLHFNKDPFKQNRSLHLLKKPDIVAMNQCASLLLKYQDFASFCKAGADNMTTICHLTEAKWDEYQGGMVFKISANRFLRNMVRAVVGTMLEVGSGKRTVDEFKEVIEACDRKASGKSAAGWALYLTNVEYERNKD